MNAMDKESYKDEYLSMTGSDLYCFYSFRRRLHDYERTVERAMLDTIE